MTAGSPILRTATSFLQVLLIVFSIYILLRGHNAPGGGFIGGLLIAAAFALHGLAFGPQAARRLLRVDPRTLVGTGLLTAALSGCLALFTGQPFMKGLWLARPIAGVGKIGTVILFDVGVYVVVLGATLLILLTLAEE
jgi:multicomponent Na+:H+ antiporter subunit B